MEFSDLGEGPTEKFMIIVIKIVILVYFILPITIAERSKTRVCGPSLAEIAGSNPAG